MHPGKRLVGKVAIVTGGASGIGAETARVFALHGAKVLLTDSNTAQGKSVASEISDSGGTAAFVAQDVCDEASWSTIVAQAEENHGRLDILCNIAGAAGQVYFPYLLRHHTIRGVSVGHGVIPVAYFGNVRFFLAHVNYPIAIVIDLRHTQRVK